MAKFAVILPAAGKSTRFGGSEKKPFVPLEGRAVWLRATEPFLNRDDVVQALIVIDPADRELFEIRYRANLAFLGGAKVIDGGTERFESVANALAALAPEVDFVAVHDAARPLVTAELIQAVFTAAEKHGAAIAAVPVGDTIKRADADTITATVPRQGLWLAQTPQVSRRDWLEAAFAKRASLGDTITDDAQLLEAAGYSVHVVAGSPLNLKVTTPEDLKLAEAVLKMRAAVKPPPPSHPFADEQMWR